MLTYDKRRGVNYTHLISKDKSVMDKTIRSIDGANNPVFQLGNEAFIFEDNVFRKDVVVDNIYDWFCVNEECSTLHLFILDKHYSKEEIKRITRLRKLVNITMGKKMVVWRQTAIMESDIDMIGDHSLDIPSLYEVPFSSSGFTGKTQEKKKGPEEYQGYNVFNIFRIGTKNVYLITIIMKDFVSKSLSSSIVSAFNTSEVEYSLGLPRKFHYDKKPSIREKFSFLNKVLGEKEYASMYEMLADRFYENLKIIPAFNVEYADLEDKDILINFRAISERV